MAQVDVRWPSEDEDFDATIDKAPAQSPQPVPEVPKSAPDESAAAHDNETEDKAAYEANAAPKAYEKEPEPDSTANEMPGPQPPLPDPADENPPVAASPASTEVQAAEVTKATVMPSRGLGRVGRIVLEAVLFIAIVGLGLWAWTLRSDNNNLRQQVKQLNANPQITIQKQTQELLTKVGKLIDLPAGETPTIANVSDVTAARKQSTFFNNAQNADKVLMYVKAGEAILYRPSTNKIILVAPLTFNNTASSGTNTAPAASAKTTR